MNTRDLLLSQPDCGEQALSLVDTIIRSGSVDVVVVDSVSKVSLFMFSRAVPVACLTFSEQIILQRRISKLFFLYCSLC